MTTPGTGAPLVELARSWLEIVGPLGVFLHADDCRAPELRHSGRLTVSVAPCPTGQSWGGLWGIRGCARSAPRRPSQPCGGVRLRSLRGPGNRFLIGRRSSAEAGSGPRTEQNRPPFSARLCSVRRRREANASRLPPNASEGMPAVVFGRHAACSTLPRPVMRRSNSRGASMPMLLCRRVGL